MKPSDPILSVKELLFRWPKQASQDALNIPKWQLHRGSRTLLLGASGSGKSTLLNIICGLCPLEKGTVNVLGQNIYSLNGRARDRFRAQNMGVIFQQFNLLPYLNVRDNILLSHQFSGKKQAHRTNLNGLLDTLRLPQSTLTRRASELSVGQQQRVAIARALIHKPSLLIADEPTSALDADNRDEFLKLLLDQCEQTGATVIFVSHDQSLATYFDQVITMQELIDS